MTEKMKFETKDLIQENIAKIGQLFPEVLTEAKDDNGILKKAIDFDKLRQILSDKAINNRETYDFTWVGKKQAILEAATPIRKTLRPCKEESVNWDTTQNLYIEGDNLDVLKLLQDCYPNQVKMIYIDPPYNKGKDFIYRDDFAVSQKEYNESDGRVDECGNRLVKNTDSNGRFHSDWCSMMYPRLKLARNLLTDDGVIFISIDEHEVDNLRKICNEIFGERNLITTLVWHNNVKGRQLDKFIKNTYEYVLLYAKNSINLTFNLEKYTLDKKEVFQDNISFYSKGYPLHNGTADFHISNRPNLAYSIYYNPTTKDAFTKDEKVIKNGQIIIGPATERREGYVRIIPKYNHKYNNQRVWRWGQEKFLKEYKTELIFVEEADGYYIYGKDRYEGNYGFKSYKNYINIDSGNGKQELVELGLGRIFDNPKTIKLIYHLLKIAIQEQSIILDFFSGSATTAHAVMKLNAEDGGNRKFIMVQLPEECDKTSEAYKAGYKNICEIGKERIRRAAKQIKEGHPESNFDGGFRVFKLADSNMKDVYYNPADYTQDLLSQMTSNIKEDRNDMDLLYGCMLEWGLPLSYPHTSEKVGSYTVHTVNNGDLMACFDENITEDIIRHIAAKKPLRVVFRDAGFTDSPAKINVGELFKLLSPDTKVKVI